MQRRDIWIASAVLALCVGAAGVARWNRTEFPARGNAAPVSAPAPSHAPIPPPPRTGPRAMSEPGLAEQLERLLASGQPEKAYDAYLLLAHCADFNRDNDRLVFDPEQIRQHHDGLPFRAMNDSEKQHDAALCSAMTERMRLSRLDYLAIAAKAGMGAAAIQMAREGPFGDRTALATRPDDPLVQAWKTDVRELLAHSAEAGDPAAIGYLFSGVLHGDELTEKNPALAYRYGVAQGMIYRDQLGADDPMGKLFAPDGELMMSIEGLSAAQRAGELEAARRLADKSRESRRQSADQAKGGKPKPIPRAAPR